MALQIFVWLFLLYIWLETLFSSICISVFFRAIQGRIILSLNYDTKHNHVQAKSAFFSEFWLHLVDGLYCYIVTAVCLCVCVVWVCVYMCMCMCLGHRWRSKIIKNEQMGIWCKIFHPQTSYLVPRYNTISNIKWHTISWPWHKPIRSRIRKEGSIFI